MPIATPQGTLDFKSVDTITFVGASSNTVIDTTTGSLGVGVDVNGPTSNLHVVGDALITGNVADLNVVSNVNMLHTSNTASIKLNSNVVVEFPRSKKFMKFPRVALTSAAGTSSGYQGFYVTESSNSANTDRHSWKAFDMTFDNTSSDNAWANDQTTTTYSGSDYAYNGSVNLGTGAVNGEWIKLQLPHKIKLEYMKIWVKDNDPTRIPEDWKLYGSDDNSNWTELFSKIGQEAINESLYNVNATSMYNYLAVVVTKISGQNNYFRIVELEYFGTPEYDPEAHGVDVVIKSVPNVPNTDWLDVYYDGQDYTQTSDFAGAGGVDNKTGVSTYDATPSAGGVGFDSTYKAFTFNKTDNQYLSTSTPMSGNYVHSFSLWFKPNSLTAGSGDALFYVGGVSGSSNYKCELFIESDRINYTFGGNNFQARDDNAPTIVNGEWYHITVTYNGLGGQNGREIYLNNVKLVATHSGSTGVLAISTNNLDIGRYTPDGSATTSAFDGSIANFRLFNRVLTPDEIYQLYAYQKEYFGHGDLSMTLKAGRLGIGTSEPKAALDVRGTFQGNSSLRFFVLNGKFPATGSTQDVTDLPSELIARADGIIFMQGISVSSNGDRVNWMRHGSSTHEVDISYDASVPKFLLSGFDASVTITSKEWRIFVVTT